MIQGHCKENITKDEINLINPYKFFIPVQGWDTNMQMSTGLTTVVITHDTIHKRAVSTTSAIVHPT